MKNTRLQVLCAILFVAVFEIVVTNIFLTESGFPQDDWPQWLGLIASTITALSQVALMGLWGGMGERALHQRVLIAGSVCTLGIFLPMTIIWGISARPYSAEFAWSVALALWFVFLFCFVYSLAIGRILRRRLVPISTTGVAVFSTNVQFGFRFMLIGIAIVGICSVLISTSRPIEIAYELGRTASTIVTGAISGVFFFAVTMSYSLILLRPKPRIRSTWIWLGVTTLFFVAIGSTLWIVNFGPNITWRFVQWILGSTLVSTMVACPIFFITVLRGLNYRLVRYDQLNVVVQSPASVPFSLRKASKGLMVKGVWLITRPWVAGPIVIVLGWIAYDWFLVDSRIYVSRETTYVTSPLEADGSVDFGAAINQRRMSGILPEENAVIDLLRVLGPKAVPNDGAADYYHWLRMEPLPQEGEYLLSFHQFLLETRLADLVGTRGSPHPNPGVAGRPWSKSDDPVGEAWLDKNRKFLDAIRRASAKSQFRVPFASSKNAANIYGTQIEFVSRLGDVTWLLDIDSTYELSRGNWQQALDDIAALRRLSKLMLGQGSELYTSLGREKLERALGLQEKLIQGIDESQLSEFIKKSGDLKTRASQRNLEEMLFAERLGILDAVVKWRYSFLSSQDLPPDYGVAGTHNFLLNRVFKSADWNEVLRKCNVAFDEYEIAINISDMKQREIALRELRARKIVDQSGWLIVPVSSIWTKKLRGQGIANVFLNQLMPDGSQFNPISQHCLSICDLTELSLALEAFRAANKKYPTSLDELTPQFLAKIPTDPFAEKPYTYLLQPDGYFLYGIGQNGLDDKGDPKRDIVFKIDR